MTDPPRKDSPLDELRDVKLRLPMHHLVRLQSFRLLKRTTISRVLSEALEQYFATTAHDDLAGARPRPAREDEGAGATA